MGLNWKTAIKIALSLGLLALLLSRMDLQKFGHTLASVSPMLLLTAVLVQLVEAVLSTWRWKTILENFRILIHFPPLLKITLIGSFFNLFLPSSIGGDFVRAYYLSRRQERSMSTTLTTTVLERSAGLCGLLILGTAFAAVHRMDVEGISLLLVFFILNFGYAAANFALFNSWFHRQISRLLRRLRFAHLETKMELVYEGLTTLRKNYSAIMMSIGISLLIQFLSIVIVWISAYAIHLKVPFYVFLVFIPLINLTIMIPLTINGIGLRESAYYLLFSQIGLPVETAVTLSLLNFVVLLCAALPGAIVYSLYKKDEPFEEAFAKAGGS